MSERFAGRVVIVTGAGSGIGRATALAFAREGAAVATADVSMDKAVSVAAEAVAAGGRAIPLECDVSQAAHGQRAVRETETALGPLDVLVNNAGIGASGTVLTTDEATFERLVAVNVRGTYLMSRAALAVMVPPPPRRHPQRGLDRRPAGPWPTAPPTSPPSSGWSASRRPWPSIS